MDEIKHNRCSESVAVCLSDLSRSVLHPAVILFFFYEKVLPSDATAAPCDLSFGHF